MNRKSRNRLLIATAIIVAVFATVVVVLVQREGAYYRQVSDLASGEYDGKTVQVGGQVVSGTISRDTDGVHFTMRDLTGEVSTVRVTYAGQTPAAFAAGVDVVVTGVYSAGVITADELETKCPSKYKARVSSSPSASSSTGQ